jgi:trk system potassium uptake protein
MSGDYAVIGLGRFGRAVALGLARMKQAVLAVDRDPVLVESVAQSVDAAICADATNERAFEELRLERFGCVVVGIGADSLEASILTTALLRQRAIPRIVARAVTDLHGRVLRATGAHEVVNPEQEMGKRLASRLTQPNVLEQLKFDEHTSLVEVAAPEAFHGKSLVDLDVRKRYRVSVVAVRRHGEVIANPRPEDTFQSGDILLVIGSRESVARLGNLA